MNPSKGAIYEALHSVNRGFEQLTADLGRLEALGFRRDLFQHYRVIVEETRAWVNFEVLQAMQGREERDWARWGKLGRKWEKQREDPHDAQLKPKGHRRK